MGPYINDVSTKGLDGVMEVAWILYCRSVPIPNLKDRDGPNPKKFADIIYGRSLCVMAGRHIY